MTDDAPDRGCPHPTRAATGGRAARGLTPEQAQAVQHGPGPLLLIAGPGAGKTKTLIHRIARLLQTGAAQPWEILAVTFSVRAAGELRLRLADLLGEQVARGVTAATFHSICARMLREHASVFGRTENYTVYDQADVRRVIEWLLSDQQRGQIQQALADYGQPAAAEVLAEISLAKNRLLSPDSYQQTARHAAAPLIAAVWRELEVELQRSNAWTSTTCSRTRSGCWPSIRIGSRSTANAGNGSSSTSSRTPTRPRASWSPCWPGRRKRLLRRRRRPAPVLVSRRGAAEHARVRRALPRA